MNQHDERIVDNQNVRAREENVAAIMRVIRASNRPVLIKDIIERTGLSRVTVTKHMKSLARQGLVEKEPFSQAYVCWTRDNFFSTVLSKIARYEWVVNEGVLRSELPREITDRVFAAKRSRVATRLEIARDLGLPRDETLKKAIRRYREQETAGALEAVGRALLPILTNFFPGCKQEWLSLGGGEDDGVDDGRVTIDAELKNVEDDFLKDGYVESTVALLEAWAWQKAGPGARISLAVNHHEQGASNAREMRFTLTRPDPYYIEVSATPGRNSSITGTGACEMALEFLKSLESMDPVGYWDRPRGPLIERVEWIEGKGDTRAIHVEFACNVTLALLLELLGQFRRETLRIGQYLEARGKLRRKREHVPRDEWEHDPLVTFTLRSNIGFHLADHLRTSSRIDPLAGACNHYLFQGAGAFTVECYERVDLDMFLVPVDDAEKRFKIFSTLLEHPGIFMSQRHKILQKMLRDERERISRIRAGLPQDDGKKE